MAVQLFFNNCSVTIIFIKVWNGNVDESLSEVRGRSFREALIRCSSSCLRKES